MYQCWYVTTGTCKYTLDVSYSPVRMPMHMQADLEDVNILGFCDKTALAKIQYQVQY